MQRVPVRDPLRCVARWRDIQERRLAHHHRRRRASWSQCRRVSLRQLHRDHDVRDRHDGGGDVGRPRRMQLRPRGSVVMPQRLRQDRLARDHQVSVFQLNRHRPSCRQCGLPTSGAPVYQCVVLRCVWCARRELVRAQALRQRDVVVLVPRTACREPLSWRDPLRPLRQRGDRFVRPPPPWRSW